MSLMNLGLRNSTKVKTEKQSVLIDLKAVQLDHFNRKSIFDLGNTLDGEIKECLFVDGN